MAEGPKPSLELFRAVSGAQSARLRYRNGKTFLLHSAVAPEQEADDLPVPELWGDVLICLGTGLGYHLEALRQVERPLQIVLCEVWPELLEAARTRLQNSVHQVIPTLLQPVSLPANAKIQIWRHPASYRASSPLLDEWADRIFLEHLPAAEKIGARSSARSVALLFGQHFLQEELRHALQERQIPVHLLEYGAETVSPDWDARSLRFLQEHRPDLILSVNMKGLDSEGILLGHARRLGIPVNVWFVDDPRPIALAQPDWVFPWIRAWCWERAYLPWLVARGFDDPRWLPLAGDPLIFQSETSPKEIYPLVFTGSSMGEDFLRQIRNHFLWEPCLAPMVDLRSEDLLEGRRSSSNLLEGWPLPFQDERNKAWLSALIQHTASHKKRVRHLRPLMSEGLLCAGDPQGWRACLGGQVHTVPDINYRHGLAEHYRHCSIQINVTSCQMPTAVNQRVFDVPLCGGFLLTDSQSDVHDLFAADELALFSSPLELEERIAWFQSHPGERKRIAENARLRILREHTYAHRLRDLMAR
ncbi:MAG TPA: glycosyltransferase [Fibrobacteraceae bacterium]|nr:glycosyltransferase [Fibrobacteraceae bacterium]